MRVTTPQNYLGEEAVLYQVPKIFCTIEKRSRWGSGGLHAWFGIAPDESWYCSWRGLVWYVLLATPKTVPPVACCQSGTFVRCGFCQCCLRRLFVHNRKLVWPRSSRGNCWYRHWLCAGRGPRHCRCCDGFAKKGAIACLPAFII